MKILMIAPQPFYSERGTPMNVRLLCKVLGEAGHKVDAELQELTQGMTGGLNIPGLG